MRTVPVNQSDGPLADGWVPMRLISISVIPRLTDLCGRVLRRLACGPRRRRGYDVGARVP